MVGQFRPSVRRDGMLTGLNWNVVNTPSGSCCAMTLPRLSYTLVVMPPLAVMTAVRWFAAS
ncbi:MAG: hypothetical protein ACLQVD_10885 [Capsulimonadaceae bacterium]